MLIKLLTEARKGRENSSAINTEDRGPQGRDNRARSAINLWLEDGYLQLVIHKLCGGAGSRCYSSNINSHIMSCVFVMHQISYVLLQFDYFVCPIDYDEVKGALSMECERSFAFRLHEYGVPWFIHSIGALV